MTRKLLTGSRLTKKKKGMKNISKGKILLSFLKQKQRKIF